MKKIIVLSIAIFMSVVCFAQGTNIRWGDPMGREFSISAPGGYFSYYALPGDFISYGTNNQPIRIGDVVIMYSNSGRPIRIGDVVICYDYSGRPIRVGNMVIMYDSYGRVISTSGSVGGY